MTFLAKDARRAWLESYTFGGRSVTEQCRRDMRPEVNVTGSKSTILRPL
jgi:hypothetical protein